MLLLGSPGPHGLKAPKDVGGPTHLVLIQVEDVDAHHARAVAGGATILAPPTDQPWGRAYELVDAEGFVFSFHA